MAIYMKTAGNILLDTGAIATDSACCCSTGGTCIATAGSQLYCYACNAYTGSPRPDNYSWLVRTVIDLGLVYTSGSDLYADGSIADQSSSYRFWRSRGATLEDDYTATASVTNIRIEYRNIGGTVTLEAIADWSWTDTAWGTVSDTDRRLIFNDGGTPSGCNIPANLPTGIQVAFFDGGDIVQISTPLFLNGVTAYGSSAKWNYKNDSADLTC